MAKHQDLTGRAAVHPFAFVSATDPALDPDNEVTANKAWIDTASGNALKIRNQANNGWTTVIGGNTQASLGWVTKPYIQKIVAEMPNTDPDPQTDWYQLTYV